MFLLLFVAWINAADGATLYYSSLNGTDTEIYRLDSVTGADALLTTVTGVQYFGLATSSAPKTIYAIDTTASTGCLYTFNVSTFANQLVGCAGVDIREIAYNLNNNILYGTNYSSLYTINTSTGAATIVGSFAGPTAIWAMGYDQGTNTLYGVDSLSSLLYTISTTTGAAALVGATGQSRITDNYVDPSTGTMFAIGNDPNNFYSINNATGAAAVVNTVTGIVAMGLAAPPPPLILAVPTMNEWGIIMFFFLAGTGSAYMIRRQQKAS
jgi:hypothetical protein